MRAQIKTYKDNWAKHFIKREKSIERVQVSGAAIIDTVAGDPSDLGPLISMANTPLFSKIQITDINQDVLADCYFESPLAGLAFRDPAGVNYIRNICYYDPSDLTHVIVQFQRNGVITRVHCDLLISPIQNQVDPSDSDLWAEMIEKAYAAYRIVGQDSFHDLDYGSPVASMQDLGCTPSQNFSGQGAAGLALAKSYFDKGLIVTAATPYGAGRGLVEDHVYCVVGFNDDGSMNLYNPWGVGYNPVPAVMPADNVPGNISYFSFGTIPPIGNPAPVTTPIPVQTFTQADIDNAVKAERIRIQNLVSVIINSL